MRPKYPIDSVENLTELKEIQEHLINLIGFDANPWDQTLEKEGTYDTCDRQIGASGTAMIYDHVYNEQAFPLYGHLYRAHLNYSIRKGKV